MDEFPSAAPHGFSCGREWYYVLRMYDIIHTSPSLLFDKAFPFRDPETQYLYSIHPNRLNSLYVKSICYLPRQVQLRIPVILLKGPRKWEVYLRYGHIQGIVYGIIPCPVQSSMSCHSGLGGAFGTLVMWGFLFFTGLSQFTMDFPFQASRGIPLTVESFSMLLNINYLCIRRFSDVVHCFD